MRIFVSWSMERSKHLSEIFSKYLPMILQNVEVFVSHADLDPGIEWNLKLNQELDSTDFGIICVTPENQNQNWIHFEAGKLSKHIENDATRLIPVCYDMDLSELVSPLSQYQGKKFDVEDIRLIFKSVNQIQEKSVPLEHFDELFDKFKKEIKKHIADTPTIDPDKIPEKRSEESMLAELLLLVRGQANTTKKKKKGLSTAGLTLLQMLMEFPDEPSNKKIGAMRFQIKRSELDDKTKANLTHFLSFGDWDSLRLYAEDKIKQLLAHY